MIWGLFVGWRRCAVPGLDLTLILRAEIPMACGFPSILVACGESLLSCQSKFVPTIGNDCYARASRTGDVKHGARFFSVMPNPTPYVSRFLRHPVRTAMTLRTALVAFGTLFATTAFASDITLAPGFTPDPMNMTITSGGTTAASTWQSNCAGWVADRQSPDIKLTWTGAGTLHISATSSADVTLVVNDANGNWHCNDDQSGTNPGLTSTALQRVSLKFGLARTRAALTPRPTSRSPRSANFSKLSGFLQGGRRHLSVAAFVVCGNGLCTGCMGDG
jgi:hypothetical protein